MVQGQCDPQFEAAKAAFEHNLSSGLDVGASVAATVNGKVVLDLWGGSIDEAGTTPWQHDTIINVWSTSKTMLALSALLLADRGELDLHAPVARYWPEFAANGKEGIEVRHILSHSSGVSGWDEPLVNADLADWERMTSLLAAQAPWWEPGTMSGYHALTMGYLVGEVVRRIAGVSYGTFLRQQITGPLDADFFVGTPADRDSQVAPVIPPPPMEMEVPPGSVCFKTIVNPILDPAGSFSIAWRRPEIPAANGHGNALSIARVQTIIGNEGEVEGKRFMSPAGVNALFEVQTAGPDLVLGVPFRFGIGYALNGPEMQLGSGGPRVCAWGGWGGSVVVNDLDRHLTFCYVPNKMSNATVGDERAYAVLAGVYAGLDD